MLALQSQPTITQSVCCVSLFLKYITRLKGDCLRVSRTVNEVIVGNDQKIAQSERNPHSNIRGGKSKIDN